ncbi:M10 family metallopeptidase C-terminal domain-containing protein [Ruegeria sp. 2205SS24-7]|uniref:M10 family metallopeptidase C-terminal domain-containing protein n=1 Tax=Ruegeria discodermiae TaxID=3064389 RepID=UPI002741B1F5|nr:M10 family metallopeptidase C-terminal domain-containing protein [Ruegeria sp. 2205SS24-7]MDP5216089.1 M10 family metallopeptidase C-terminal domain-containing protein [Ruegeria sp. 2205SS24-7]
MRSSFDAIAGFTGLDFVEVTEIEGTEAALRFMLETSRPASYFNAPFEESAGGDAFTSISYFDLAPGGEAFHEILQMVGNSMGLVNGSFAGEFAGSEFDSPEFTARTWTEYVGDPDPLSSTYTRVDGPQSFMQLDIAALQYLYGANYSTSGEVWSGDTTYRFNPNTGEMMINGQGQGAPFGNRIFRTIWDGDGNDTYDLSNYETKLQVDLRPGAFSTFSKAQLARLDRFADDPIPLAAGNVANALLVDGDTRALIENATGGSGNDHIVGNLANNILNGGTGHDTLNGFKGTDRLIGGQGDDNLIGGLGNDRLWGADDHDRLSGGDGLDRLYGGAGNDTLLGDDGNDVILAGHGVDLLAGGNGDDRLSGLQGRDRLQGGAGNDTLLGDDGDDVIFAGHGVDVLTGGNGHDELSGLQGRDYLYGGAGNDTLLGGDGNDVMRAGQGMDVLAGGNGTDRLFGLQGRDTLKGAAGNDTINGGIGADQLYGGAGTDRFEFVSASDSNGANGIDTIHDFAVGVDVIDLSALFEGQATLVLGGDFAAGSASVRAFDQAGATIVEADTNANGIANFRLEFTSALQLSEADFLL